MVGQQKNISKHAYLCFVTAWVFFLIVILLIIGGVSYWSLVQSRKDFERVFHTHDVIGELSLLLSGLEDTETGQRGQLITRQQGNFEPYQSIEKMVEQRFANLRKMMVDNPGQQKRLDIVRRLVADKLTELRQTDALQTDKAMEAATNVVLTDKAKPIMDDIRKLVLEMRAKQEGLLKQWAENAMASVRLTVATMCAGVAMSFAAIILAILRINHDIAERGRAVHALKQAKDDADAANKAKGEFLANMSHEIRTPMNAIIGFSEVLAEEIRLTDEEKHYVDLIQESSQILLQVINDILDFSRIEAGKLDIEIIDCSLGRLLIVVESLMRPAAIEKGLEFKILQCGELPAQIRTDPVRLHQCLINLINNAIKFTERGHVYVNVSLQEVNDKGTPEPYIYFDVEDTGIGIPVDKQGSIFEEFMQVEGGCASKYGGAGLGLAITKRLAHLLGGELTLTSEMDKGSTFSLMIPAGIDVKSQPLFNKYDFVNELNQEPDTPDAPEQAKFSGRVLVAEDSPTNQTLIKLLLEKMGLQVTITENGNQAVREALSQAFDLILMDIQMPNMNGYEATRTLRRKSVKTPIVALTAHAMKGDDQKCISAGCDDYLAKPIDRKELLEIICKYLVPAKSRV